MIYLQGAQSEIEIRRDGCIRSDCLLNIRLKTKFTAAINSF